MAEIILDLSGRSGLTDFDSGNTDKLTPTPDRTLDNGTAELASGNFNPYLRNGYLAPTTTTLISVSSDTSPYSELSSCVYDSLTGEMYFGERAGQSGVTYPGVYSLSSLTDTSLTLIQTLTEATAISDLEIYTINNERKLFYVWESSKVVMNASISDIDNMWTSLMFAVNKSGTAIPRVIASGNEDLTAASRTISLSVPTSSNAVAFLLCTYNGTAEYLPTVITYDGATMTLKETISTYTISNGTQYTHVYYKTGAATGGTKSFVITHGSSITQRSVAFVVDNVNQTTPLTSIEKFNGVGTSVASSITLPDVNTAVFLFTVCGKSKHILAGAAKNSTLNVSAQTGGNGQGIAFNTDGTKMYVQSNTSPSNYKIYQYTLSTAWDIATATYATKSMSFQTQWAGSVSAIKFNKDGTKVYLDSYTNNEILQYNLGTAWDISTASYYNKFSFSSVSGLNHINGFDISVDGKKIIISGLNNTEIQYHFVYEISLGTAWDITTASYTGRKFNHVPIPKSVSEIKNIRFIDNDTAIIYIYSDISVHKLLFNPLFPYDVSKLTYSSDKFTPASASNVQYVQPDGSNYYGRKTNDDIAWFTLSGASALADISSTDINVCENKPAMFLSYLLSYTNLGAHLVDVGISSLPAGTVNNNNWLTNTMTTYVSTNSDYNFIRLADNGFAYLFAGNSVSKIDGSTTGGQDGYVTKDVLLFPNYFNIKDAVDYRSTLYIAINQYVTSTTTTNLNNYVGSCGIYVWDRISTKLSSASYIELPGVREIKKIYVSPDQVLKLITISASGVTELREFGYNDSGGVVFRVKKTLGIGAYPQYPDGLTNAGDKVTWIGNDGNMYSEKENRIVNIAVIKTPGTTTTASLANNISSGVMLYGSGLETANSGSREYKQGIYLSYKDGSTVYTKKIYPFDLKTGSNGDQTPRQGDVYTGVKLMPVTSKVNNIRIYNAPTSTSDDTVIATVKIYFNQSTTATMPTGMTKSITKKEAKRGYVDFHINRQYIHAVQIEVEWATGTSIGDDMYMPSVAVVTYDELPTQSPDNG